jgi:hypothetical protein
VAMSIGRTVMMLGALLFAIGLVLWIGERSPLRIGRLPGDIVIRGKSGVFYFPLVTCLLLSLLGSLLLWILNRR